MNQSIKVLFYVHSNVISDPKAKKKKKKDICIN